MGIDAPPRSTAETDEPSAGELVTSFRVLLFGYGFAGAWIHDPLIRSVPGLDVVSVVTSDPERSRLARSRHPDVNVYSSAEEALQRTAADVVVVATPNRFHVELASASIRAGVRAVVVDKPLANTSREAARLIEEAGRTSTTLSVFHNRRWDGDFMTIRRLIQDGRIGSIHHLTSRFDRWIPDPPPDWRHDEVESGGGLLLDLGSHLVDQAMLLLGPPSLVHCETKILAAGRRSEDWFFLSLRHLSGAISHLGVSALEGRPGLRFHVSGSEGAYVKHGKDIQEERLLAGDTPATTRIGTEPREGWGRIHRGTATESVETIPGDWAGFYRDLVDHLRGEGPNPVAGEEALEVLSVLDAARLSAQQDEVVRVDHASDPEIA